MYVEKIFFLVNSYVATQELCVNDKVIHCFSTQENAFSEMLISISLCCLNIMFDVVNDVLVQKNRKDLHISLMKSLSILFQGLYKEKKEIFIFIQIVLVAPQELRSCKLFAFRIIVWL